MFPGHSVLYDNASGLVPRSFWTRMNELEENLDLVVLNEQLRNRSVSWNNETARIKTVVLEPSLSLAAHATRCQRIRPMETVSARLLHSRQKKSLSSTRLILSASQSSTSSTSSGPCIFDQTEPLATTTEVCEGCLCTGREPKHVGDSITGTSTFTSAAGSFVFEHNS